MIVSGPDEWVAAVVPAVDKCADRLDQVVDGGEGAAVDGLASDDPEEYLDHVEPRPRRRGEVQGDPRVARQPGLDGRVLVGRVVVADQVQLLARVGLGHLLEEGQELLVAVPGQAGLLDPRPCGSPEFSLSP